MKFTIEPPSSVANIAVGEIFRLEQDKQLYILIHRDAAKCIVRPWTRLDKIMVHIRLIYLKALLFFRGERNGRQD